MRALIDNLVWYGRIISQRFTQSVPTAISRSGGTQRDINRPQHYGLATAPPDGSTIVGVAHHGSGRNTIGVLTYNKEATPTDLAEGDVAIFTSNGGQQIRLTAEDGEVNITGSNVRINGVLRVTDTDVFILINEREVSLSTFITLHTHTSNAPGLQTGIATLP